MQLTGPEKAASKRLVNTVSSTDPSKMRYALLSERAGSGFPGIWRFGSSSLGLTSGVPPGRCTTVAGREGVWAGAGALGPASAKAGLEYEKSGGFLARISS